MELIWFYGYGRSTGRMYSGQRRVSLAKWYLVRSMPAYAKYKKREKT